MITPLIGRDRIHTMLVEDESIGEIVNVTALDTELKVEINKANKNRLDFDIPLEPIADLDIAAGVVRQRSA